MPPSIDPRSINAPRSPQHPNDRPWENTPASLIITLLIGFLPITMMTELRGGSANFWILISTCLIISYIRPGGIRVTLLSLRSYRWLYLALLILPITVVLAMLWSKQLLGQDTERALRISLGVLTVLTTCLCLNAALLRQSMWGLMAGVIGGTGSLVWESWPTLSRPDMDQYTTVGYSNVLLLLTTLVLFSLGWKLTGFRRVEQWLKIVTALIGFAGLVIAETRSSWVAIPFFILIGLFLIRSEVSQKRLLLMAAAVVTLAISMFFVNQSLVDRVKQGAQEFTACQTTTPLADTSVCIRLQLWRASWQMFKSNPFLANAGSSKFVPKLEELHKQGIVSAFTKSDFGEPHNDLFYALANYGLMGLISFLAIYSAPAVIFARRLTTRENATELRVAAAMGLVVCIGFIVFGLTEAMFRSMRMLSFYAVLVAWLLALSDSVGAVRDKPSQRSLQ